MTETYPVNTSPHRKRTSTSSDGQQEMLRASTQRPAIKSLGNALLEPELLGEPEEVATGVFFLKGGTRYFQEGTQAGPGGSISSLMCNNGWIVLGDYVLLIDANMPGRASALIESVGTTTDKPIRYILNTHHHGDHIYGNQLLVERTGATVIAHKGMVEELLRYETGPFGGAPGRMEQVAQARSDVAATNIWVPTWTFDQSLVLEGGGRKVELKHLGLGHTRGDAIAWVPDARVLFAGDLLTNGPFNIVRDAEMEPWFDTLAAMQSLGASIICPGHGDRGDPMLLADQLAFVGMLLKQVKQRVEDGQTKEKVLAETETIRVALLADPASARFVIPHKADLAVLSLRAQIERTFDQMSARTHNSKFHPYAQQRWGQLCR